MTTARAGGLAIVVFAVAGVAEFAQELAPVANGFSDTDDPAVMLRFIREHPEAYRWGGLALFVMAASLVVAALEHSSVGLSLWATAVSVTGIRSHTLPTLVGIVGIFPVLRLTGSLLGPLELLPEDLWIVFMASIVGTLIWCLVLGIVLLRIPSCLPVAVPMRA